MKREFGEFALEWRKVPGMVKVNYEVYEDYTGDTRPEETMMSLFDFLSSLGITKEHCIRAFDNEDAE